MFSMTATDGRFKVSHPIVGGFGWWTAPAIPIRVDDNAPNVGITRFVDVPAQSLETVEAFLDAIAGPDRDPEVSPYGFSEPEWFDFWASVHPYVMFGNFEANTVDSPGLQESIAARAAYAVDQHRKSLSWWKRWIFDRLKMGAGMSDQVTKVIRIQLSEESTLRDAHSYSA